MDLESVRREALKRQLTSVLERLDSRRDAALTHDMLQLSRAMIGYVSQHMQAQETPDEAAQEQLTDLQLALAQAACDLYPAQKERLDEQERKIAEEARHGAQALSKQQEALQKAVGDVQQLRRTLMHTEMEARQTALQREAMRSRAALREE